MPLSTSHLEDTFVSKEEGIKRLLSSILNFNLQHEVNEKHIISIINKLLATAKHRREGLEYLNIVIENCGTSVIAENALNWTGHCLIKFADDVLKELKLRVIGIIIEVAHNESEFNKKFVSEYISKVLDSCITTSHVNPYECKAALKTLVVLMRYYASWFGAHRQKIEDYLLVFLDSENDDVVQSAALAFHYLQQVGSAGANGVNHKSNFTQNFHKLCRTVQKLYDSFFENEKEIFYTGRSNDDVFKFQENPNSNSHVLLHINSRRIRNALKFIETMIKTKFPVAKETKPKELLEVITRGTSYHKCISGDSIESLENYQFSLLLSEIQCAVIKLLRLFIIWYQTNCLPFSYSISKVLVDSIERSHNCECFKYDSLYQESSYRALSEWLTVSKSSFHPQFQSQILVCILKDITPVKSQITLTISEAASGKKSQKAKRKAMASRIIASGNQTLTQDSSTSFEKSNEKNTCKFALTALRHLLELTRLSVKPTLLKDLYKSLFDSLMTTQSSKPLHLYTDAQCQEKLYEALVAIYHQDTLSTLPPLQTTLDILSRGANNNDRFISNVCQRGLRALEMLCQPICPSLYMGVEKAEDEMEVVREVREVVEKMAVDQDSDKEVNNVDDDDVDFDASTDEFPQNFSSKQDRIADSPDYQVKYPDTDPSMGDDLSDKGDKNDEMGFEELNVEAEEEIEIINHPRVTAPSEDGNEVLERGSNEPEEQTVGKEKEVNIDFSNDSKQEESTERNTAVNSQNQDDSKQEDSNNFDKAEKSTVTFEDVTDTENDTLKEDTGEAPISEIEKENSEQIPAQKAAQAEEINAILQKNTKENEKCSPTELETEEQNEADSTSLQEDVDEPPAKKARSISEDDMDMGDVFEEKAEIKEKTDKDVDPDESYLEDDSFVDEVKDYY